LKSYRENLVGVMKKKKQAIDETAVRLEELNEIVDELLQYFELDDDNYTEPSQIAVVSRYGEYTLGMVDGELQDLLTRMYELHSSMK
jgi:hypothetical protein